MTALGFLSLLRRFGPYFAGAAALIGAYLWIEHHGYARGVAHVEARDAKLAARIDAARQKLLGRMQADDAVLAAADANRQTIVREITREVPTIINRPVYAGACLDSDGLRILARGTSAANGEREAGAGAAAPAGEVPAADRH